MFRSLGGVEVFHEVSDAAFVVVSDLANGHGIIEIHIGIVVGGDRHPLIDQGQGESLVEEAHLLEAARERGEVVVDGLEDAAVGPVGDRGPGVVGRLLL